MKTVFMGTPDFARVSLEALCENGYEVSAVFTQPDKPVGRHKVLTASPVKEEALKRNIAVYQPNTLKDGEAEKIIRELSPDIIAVVAYGKIIPEEILNIPRFGCINVHGSLLPKYRGAAPIQWSVINGEKYAGVTTMYMDKGLDTGDIIICEKTQISENETSGELFERLAPIGAELLVKTFKLIESGNAPRIPQNNDEFSYAPMLSKEMAELDFSKDAETLNNLIAGLNPWPVAFTMLDGKRLKIYKSRVCTLCGEAGKVLDEKKFIIACGTKSLEILQLQLEGSKLQSGEEFLRGHRLFDFKF